jgi:hypothetical protein
MRLTGSRIWSVAFAKRIFSNTAAPERIKAANTTPTMKIVMAILKAVLIFSRAMIKEKYEVKEAEDNAEFT